MLANTVPDVDPSQTPTQAERTAPSFPTHPYVTNAEELAADGLVQHSPHAPVSNDDPFQSMADRIRAEGI